MTAALAAPSSYRERVREGCYRWPDVGHALLDELSAVRGRVCLIAASTPVAADILVDRLRTDLDLTVASLGQALASTSQSPTMDDIEAACSDATVITDIDLLFWPTLRVPVLPFLKNRGRRHVTIAVWPGEITGGRAVYSAPGRPDRQDLAVHDAIVIRPRQTRFPDEVPFDLERILT